MPKKKDELREILVRLMYCASENAFYSPKSLDQAQREIEALRLSEEEIKEVIDAFMIKSPERTSIYFDEVEDLAHAIFKAQEGR